jgi:acyl carrier protein
LASRGIGSFTPTEGLRALQQLLKQDSTQTAIVPFDLNRWQESHSLNGKSPFFEKLRTESDGEPAATKVSRRDADIRSALETAGSGRRRRALLESHIREHVRQVLRLSASRVDSHKTFKSQGLDSLTALELCNRLETGLKISLSPTLVWNYPNIALLAAHLGDMMKISLNDAVEPRVEPESGVEDGEKLERILKDIEQLSDKDARRLLDEGSS